MDILLATYFRDLLDIKRINSPTGNKEFSTSYKRIEEMIYSLKNILYEYLSLEASLSLDKWT